MTLYTALSSCTWNTRWILGLILQYFVYRVLPVLALLLIALAIAALIARRKLEDRADDFLVGLNPVRYSYRSAVAAVKFPFTPNGKYFFKQSMAQGKAGGNWAVNRWKENTLKKLTKSSQANKANQKGIGWLDLATAKLTSNRSAPAALATEKGSSSITQRRPSGSSGSSAAAPSTSFAESKRAFKSAATQRYNDSVDEYTAKYKVGEGSTVLGGTRKGVLNAKVENSGHARRNPRN